MDFRFQLSESLKEPIFIHGSYGPVLIRTRGQSSCDWGIFVLDSMLARMTELSITGIQDVEIPWPGVLSDSANA